MHDDIYDVQPLAMILNYLFFLTLNINPQVYGSHPDIHRAHYPDVTRHTTPHPPHNYPFALNPNVLTDRTQLHYVNVYKPPPPYPSNGLASNSTPDLAVASQALNYHRGYIGAHVSGSSPDLVSTRTRQYLGYLNTAYGSPVHASTHGTYNNLASVLDVPNPHIIMDPHHISDNIQKVYDERGNIMYSMPHRIPYQRHVVIPQTQIKINDADEPIYENVPLPWQSDGKVMRDRAHSLTTTDEINRLNERNSSHSAINHYGQLAKATLAVPNYPHIPKDDSHYVNAQIIKGVRESSVPKDLNVSNRTINREPEFENVTLSVERLSVSRDDKDYDETPYTSLSTQKVSGNDKSMENVTCIAVPDGRVSISTANSTINSAYSGLELESSANTTKSSSASGEFVLFSSVQFSYLLHNHMDVKMIQYLM